MSRKLLVLAVVALFFAPIKGDNITDIIEEGYRQIEALSNNAATVISDGRAVISETREYSTKTVETFSQQGREAVTNAETSLNTTADDLFAQAVTADDPIKVIECIAKAHNTAISNIAKALSTFLSDLANAQSSGDSTILLAETVLNLAEDTLPGLLEASKQKIATCVSQVCVDNNLTIIQEEYDTLSGNLSAETDKVKQVRTSFSQNTSNLLQKFETTVSNDETSGEKQMRKCL